MKILIMGLPGSGKTTLARELARCLSAVWFNADEVRSNINGHLGFSEEDRIQQAKTMGWISEQVSKTGNVVIADFVCPTPESHKAYGQYGGPPSCLIWMNNIDSGRFEDTNKIFTPPSNPDIVIDYLPISSGSQVDRNSLRRAVAEVIDYLGFPLVHNTDYVV